MSGQTPAPNDWCVTTTAELAELQRLRRDNAELLEALKQILSKSETGNWLERYIANDRARAAIAKAEGRT